MQHLTMRLNMQISSLENYKLIKLDILEATLQLLLIYPNKKLTRVEKYDTIIKIFELVL